MGQIPRSTERILVTGQIQLLAQCTLPVKGLQMPTYKMKLIFQHWT